MNKLLNDYKDGEHFIGQLLISSASKCVNNLGSNYFNLDLRDSSGTINAKKWDITTNDEEILLQGNIINVVGEILKYKESLQLKVLSCELVNSEDVDVSRFLKQPPVPKEELINRFEAHIASIKDEDARKIVEYIVNKYKASVYEYPAAVSVHHEYSSGLLMHTVSMADLADYLSSYYSNINKDMLKAGVLLHDLGKVIEFEGKVVYKYSLEGKLLGHISLINAEVREAAHALKIEGETPILLEHMVLSHHGQLEFGSPVMPLTKEALLLSLIDNMDSKMVIVEKALESVNEGEFTQKIFPLDNRMFYKAKK